MTFEEFEKEWFNEEPEVIAHTSGSTGKPKQIRLRKEAMRRSAWRTMHALYGNFFDRERDRKEYRLTERPLSRFHSCVAADYIGGKMMAVRAWEADALFSAETPSNYPLSGFSSTDRIDLLSVVPSQLENIIDRMSQGEALPSIGDILVGGAPLPHSLKERIGRMKLPEGLRIWETYGMTETCSHIALRAVKSPDTNGAFSTSSSSGLFVPLPGIKLSLDERECLIIEIDGERVVTNDIVALSGNGFTVIGRYDNAIITGGLKVLPEMGERLLAPLLNQYGIMTFALTSRPHDKWGEELLLAIPENEKSDYRAESLLNDLKKHLAVQYIPKAILSVTELPYLPNGKIDRCLLRAIASTFPSKERDL
ncbi:MAG: AMP-binding protein [Bacteroides sp.]|nr:AMP-binding protein [Bacteroides sp.]